ncbi:MAG: metallophosphoesterase [Nitrospira sp.]|nr:metallophosphoesterase [Nitrospira sp.]
MPSLITNRGELIRVATATLQQIQFGALDKIAGLASLESLESAETVPPEDVAAALAEALQWAERDIQGGGAALESADADAGVIPYIPSNQVLALIQSAYDEFAEEKAKEQTAELEIPFDVIDPGWLKIAYEKLKAVFRGNRKFIKHTSLESFRHDLPANAVVALLADWGTGEPTAQRVMKQIQACGPTHVIHLGDVYYSGTPREVETRFLDVIDQCGPPRSTCKYLALNSNHEMYSGGYGYFDSTLPAFGQEASYFSLGNDHWQLIGIDSGYEDHGLQEPQKEWVAAQLMRPGPKNIMLSHHQLFSPYESAAGKPLPAKMKDLLPSIHGWFWGHEHKCIIMGEHLGIKARCIGHGAIPSPVPFGPSHFIDVPVESIDERRSPDGVNFHGFALLKFAGSRLDISYIDEFGTVFFAEKWDASAAPAA